MMKAITPAQISEIKSMVDRYVAGLTTQHSDETYISAAKELMSFAGIDLPVVIVDNPAQLWAQFGYQSKDHVWYRVRDRFWDLVIDPVRDQVCRQVIDQALYQVWLQVRDQVWEQVYRQVYLVRAEAMHIIGCRYSPGFLERCRRIFTPLTFWMVCNDTFYVCRKPLEIHWNGRVLHNESGPSIRYRGGFNIWSLDGCQVDEQLVMRPETQTTEQIEGEKNSDIRAIRLNRYGIGRYLTETGASVLDERWNDIEGTHEALLKDRKGRVWLWPTCPSGNECPPLGVPDGIKTCERAQKWLHRGARVVART